MTDMVQAMEKIQKIYQMLEDQESKDIYISRLTYLISKDFKHMLPCVNTFLWRLKKGIDENPGIPAEELIHLLPENRNVVLYGAGEIGKAALPCFQRDQRFIGFCSATKEKQEKGYLGYPVMSPEELFARKDLSVVISTFRYNADIRQFLEDNGYPSELIFDGSLSQGDGEAEQYFGPDFMKFCDEEVFVDAGCYDFDSTLALAKHCKRVKKVYAFEPDPHNYPKCLDAFKKTSRKRILEAKIFPCATWSERTALRFSALGTVSSTVCEEASPLSFTPKPSQFDSSISAMPIDEAIDSGDHITMIKMDVEGSELESLKGAKQTIMRDRPKLAICIYHKPEDLWEIPLYIKSLVPEYRFYIRHHSFMLYDTVLYAVMPE